MKWIKLMFDFLFQIKMIIQVVLLHHDNMFLICFFATNTKVGWRASIKLFCTTHACFYWYMSSNRGHCVLISIYVYNILQDETIYDIPASSKGCCLNPKGWCIGTPYHPFSTLWKIQVYICSQGYRSRCSVLQEVVYGYFPDLPKRSVPRSSGGRNQIQVYTQSTLAEQTTPAVFAVSDLVAMVPWRLFQKWEVVKGVGDTQILCMYSLFS